MTPEPVTLSQLARYLGVTPTAVSNWQSRYKTEFPSPVKTDGRRRLYNLDDVVKFVRERGLKESSTDVLLDAIFPEADKKRREELDGFVYRTLGELRNVCPIEEALRFTAMFAVRAMVARSKLKLSRTVSESLDQLNREISLRSEQSRICRSLEQVWHERTPDCTSRELADAIYRVVLRHARVIGHFEHATPESLALLIQKLAPGSRVLNIGSGVGLLAEAYGRSGSTLTAQEINSSTANFHRLLAALAGYEVDLRTENALTTPHPEWTTDPFDAVVSNPPWNVMVDPESIDLSDSRWRALSEFRSKNILDYFIESSLAYLRSSDGNQRHRAILCLPPSWLSSGQAFRMRNFLVRNDYVEGVIQLGDGISLNSNVPPALLVLSKLRIPRSSVRMIDAREIGTRGNRRHREITGLEIDQLVSVFDSDVATDRGQLRVVDVSTGDLRNDQVLLTPSRYAALNVPKQSLDEATTTLDSTTKYLVENLERLLDGMRALRAEGLVEVLRDQSIADTRRIHLHGVASSQILQTKVMTRQQGSEFSSEEIRPEDVVICLGGGSLGEAESGQEVLESRRSWPRVATLRVLDRETIDPNFLLMWARFGGLKEYLESQRVSATTPFLGRQVLEDVVIPIPPLAIQKDISKWAQPVIELTRFLGRPSANTDRRNTETQTREGHFASHGEAVRQLAASTSAIFQSALGPVTGSQRG